MAPEKRLSGSFMVSFSLHVIFAAFYLYLHSQQKDALKLLEGVELIESTPQPVPEERAERPPKNVLEFLKMALPTFTKPELKTVDERPDLRERLKIPETQKIDLTKQIRLPQSPAIDLSMKSAPQQARLTEVLPSAADLSQKPSRALADVSPTPIQLEEVGRKAVALPPGAAIYITSDKTAPAPTSLREIQAAIVVPPRGETSLKGTQEGPISISKAPPAVTSPAPELPIGFSKGSGKDTFREAPVVVPRLSEVTQVEKRPSQVSPVEKAPEKKSAVEITGPISQRKIVQAPLPRYPEWARRKGVEADVMIRFYVSPDGAVLQKLYLEKTSGWRELDALCEEALRKWVFETVAASLGSQWGIVTFRFRLE